MVDGRIGPAYRLVADDIRGRIISGEYEVGQPIPSTPRLSEQYGVSKTVIRRAVELLAGDGILIGHAGKAVYVRARPQDDGGGRDDLGELATAVARIEANLIELYGRTGYDYPQDQDGTAPPGRHSRAGAS